LRRWFAPAPGKWDGARRDRIDLFARGQFLAIRRKFRATANVVIDEAAGAIDIAFLAGNEERGDDIPGACTCSERADRSLCRVGMAQRMVPE
jgi:hypothetical protein